MTPLEQVRSDLTALGLREAAGVVDEVLDAAALSLVSTNGVKTSGFSALCN